MIADLIIRYIHFVGIMTLAAAVLGQALLLRRSVPRRLVSHLSVLDKIYALSVIVVLAAGLLLWFKVGKPADYYTKNGIFHAKLLVFLVIGLVSIYPSLFFAKARRGEPDELVRVPPLVTWSVRLELLLLAVMPLLASLMAKGIGLNWS